MRTRARRVVIVLFDEVELLDVAAPLQVLSVAGRRWNFRPFKVELAAPAQGLVSTRNQARLEASSALAQAEPAEIVLVPGGYGARRFAADPAQLAELTRIASGAELLAGVGAGVLALARAGLCGDERVATVPELLPEFEGLSAPPVCDVKARLVEGKRVFSAAASGAALSLALGLVGRTMGPKLISMVAAELGLEPEPAQTLEVRY
ncbi:MAG: DJ-1/PfpI family protein [Polyangiaceae bacterium]